MAHHWCIKTGAGSGRMVEDWTHVGGLLAILVNCVTKRFSQVPLMFITKQLLCCFKDLLHIMMY